MPYNSYLLAFFFFYYHMYVEACSTIESVKYLYKYVYKGHDKVCFKVAANGEERVIDETRSFQSDR